DDARIAKFTADGDQGVGAIDSGEAKIHEGDIGAVTAKLDNGFRAVGSLRDQLHVRLRTNNGTQAFAEDGVVFHHQDANWKCVDDGSLPAGVRGACKAELCQSRIQRGPGRTGSETRDSGV